MQTKIVFLRSGVGVPRIFDNIDESLLPALNDRLLLAKQADFCVGYFNLRGGKRLNRAIEAIFCIHGKTSPEPTGAPLRVCR